MMVESDFLILLDIMWSDDTVLLFQMGIIGIYESTTVEWLRRGEEFSDSHLVHRIHYAIISTESSCICGWRREILLWNIFQHSYPCIRKDSCERWLSIIEKIYWLISITHIFIQDIMTGLFKWSHRIYQCDFLVNFSTASEKAQIRTSGKVNHFIQTGRTLQPMFPSSLVVIYGASLEIHVFI